MKVLKSIIARSNDTIINVQLTEPLTVNTSKKHAIQLYSFMYSNVFANIVSKNAYDMKVSPNNSWTLTYNGTNITISEATYTTPAIGELTDIYKFITQTVNEAIKTQTGASGDIEAMKMELSNYGKCIVSFTSSCSNINFTNQSILSSNYCGNFTSSLTSSTNTSPKMPSVSTYNRINLNCSLVGNSSYVMDENDKMQASQVIASQTSAGKAFEMFDWTASVPVVYPITLSNTLYGFKFELRDEFNNKLQQLTDSMTDFSVWIAILEEI